MRYSLRSLLLAVAIAATWFGVLHHGRMKQIRALAWCRSVGASVYLPEDDQVRWVDWISAACASSAVRVDGIRFPNEVRWTRKQLCELREQFPDTLIVAFAGR